MLFFIALCINTFIFKPVNHKYKFSCSDANFEVDLEEAK